jgi:release factor glutamine methyltransferase
MAAAGVDSPRLTALILLEHAAGIRREAALAHPEIEPSGESASRFRALVERRTEREPLAYLVGYRDFYGRRLHSSPTALIPRPETEGLVALALERMAAGEAVLDPDERILLDVGTGGGAIAVTLLAEDRSWRAVGTDTAASALALARANAERVGVAHRLQLICCRLAEGVRGRFPLVVANLPYVPRGEIDALAPEVRKYEPRGALDGGPDGMGAIGALLETLPEAVAVGGSALLEVGDGQAPALAARARQLCPGWSIGVERDLAGIERYLVLDRV